MAMNKGVWGCTPEGHKCGGMPDLSHRCDAYEAAYTEARGNATVCLSWWETLQMMRSSATGSFQRPCNCILQNRLIAADQERFPYIAVSYVWEVNLRRIAWEGRRVTTQALAIAERLGEHTSLPLWIDAICINQDDEPSKMAELAKMADIYRGASAVVCLIPEMGEGASEAFSQATAMMEADAFKSLEKGGDLYGSYMFATLGENSHLCDLYGSRWWTRAWTFQEAVLNSQTYLIGPSDETVPIGNALKLALSVRRYASTMPGEMTLGQSMAFWDSTATMVEVASRAIPLGDAMACVWRRDATVKHDLAYAMLGVCQLERIKPDYAIPLNDVLASLVEHAIAEGDYSWVAWCRTIPQDVVNGMCMVPTPDRVYSCSFTSITKLQSKTVHPFPAPRFEGSEGVLVPYQSTGVVRWWSSPQSLEDTMKTLKTRGFDSHEIWDMLFGMHVGLIADIEAAIGAPCPSEALLHCVLDVDRGTLRLGPEHRDMRGKLPFTESIGFMNYLGMAGQCWKHTSLTIVVSQGGTAVVPALSSHVNDDAKKNARLHALPVELGEQRAIVILVYDHTMLHVSGIGVMVNRQGAGRGKWLSCKFG